MPSNAHHCPKCNLPCGSSARAGSLTSFLFMDMHCQCDNLNRQANKGRAAADSKSCKRCGKVIAGPKRLGSFTGFLLGDLRCSCATPLLQGASANAMETRYRPPQATWGKRKEQMQTAMRTRVGNFASDTALISLAPGAIVGGCYQLLEMIGKGGMGVVYKARHTALNRILALKFVAPSMVSRESWQLFQQEAKLNATLSHPSLCQIYDLGIHANALPYYAMDFVSGQTLEEIIINSGPLSVGATLEIFIKVAEGLSYAHRRNVVHRDIKPANIMISSTTGDTAEVKLLDFGIAELGTKGSNTGQKTERIIGSAAYMSPEQFAGRTTDARADIYSMGCSIFETLTGNVPFEGDDFSTMAKQHTNVEPRLLSDATGLVFPLAIEAIVKKCLHKMRDQRYQNASELAIDLQRVLDNKDLQFARAEQESLQQQRQKTTAPSTPRIVIVASFAVAFIFVVAIKLTDFTHKTLMQHAPKSTTSNAPKQGGSDFIQEGRREFADELAEAETAESIESIESTLSSVKENQFYLETIQSKSTEPIRVFKFPFRTNSATPARIASPGTDYYACTGICKTSSNEIVLAIIHDYLHLENFLKGFRREDITGLDISDCIDAKTNLLKTAIKRFRLKSLSLNNTQWISSNLNLLNGLAPESSLELGLDSTDDIGENPSQLPPLKNIKELRLKNCHHKLAQILATPDKMPMSTLTLIDSPLSDDDVRLISKWPNLNTINIYKRDYDKPSSYPPAIAPKRESNASYLEKFLNNPKLTALHVYDSSLKLRTLDLEKLTHVNRDLALHLDGLRLSPSNLSAIKDLQSKFKTVKITTPPSE
ncbi:MAG: serine/threonine protein kinase [Candidatus Obscuribacter sp.]|nr:serine/threonine protein kinase [Candidatus Obscuribacter sp.]